MLDFLKVMSMVRFVFCFIFFVAFINTETISQEEVKIPTFDSRNLHGTLWLPEGQDLPCVILVHGSGPNDRNQTLPLTSPNAACLYPNLFGSSIENFREISSYLFQENIAVLQYDKRTYTYGIEIPEKEIKFQDFINDAAAVYEFAAAKREINEEKIFLLGHSQGEDIIIHVEAKTKSRPAGLICLAGSSSPLDSLLANQFKGIFEKCAMDTTLAKVYHDSTLSAFKDLRGMKDWKQEIFYINTSPPVRLGYKHFWKDWVEKADNSIDDYDKSDRPLLFIHGRLDQNVPFQDLRRFESRLSNQANREFYIIDDMNHFLTYEDNPHVHEECLSLISKWINRICVGTGGYMEKTKVINIYDSESNILSSINVAVDFDLKDLIFVELDGRFEALNYSYNNIDLICIKSNHIGTRSERFGFLIAVANDNKAYNTGLINIVR